MHNGFELIAREWITNNDMWSDGHRKHVIRTMEQDVFPRIENQIQKSIQGGEKALDLAKSGDLILIAGKGHERSQTFAHHTIPFDDAEVAHEISIQKFNNLQRSGSVLL